jgi:UDP-N-acetyl-2-amino-2-deoxyglucuronate dehydrogenase
MAASSLVRMCVVGCGNIAKAHLAAIGRNQARDVAAGISVTCLCDPNEANIAQFAALVEATCGAKPVHFSSLEAALATAGDLFDAVNICVPNDLHELVALQAFAAGKHVLLEKPIALDTASANRILAAARAAGTVFMVAENAQYWKEILVVQRCIQERRFGDVVTVRAKCWESTADENEWQGDYAPGLWRSDPRRAGGGYVFDSASHW